MTDDRLPALAAGVAGIAHRHPCVGLAVAVVRDGEARFFAHGLADIAGSTPVCEDTVFRIGSVTKTMTAVAVMQLRDRGLIDLDAPAGDYLRAYRLVPVRGDYRPVTVRHLLTHTAGIREVWRPSGLLRPRDLGETVPHGRPVPSPAHYYGGRLPVEAEPGTRFMYTNHGFVTLGQIVADVTGRPLADYLREHVFDPLGMTHTDLVRSRRVQPRLATGYELRRHGAEPVPDYDLLTAGAGGVFSTPRDLARYVAALLGGGRNRHGSVLSPATVAEMFAPQYRPDPRLCGIGLGFFRTDLGAALAVEHDGIMPGFDAQIFLVPGAGAGAVALANGARRGMHWLAPEAAGLLRDLLGIADPGTRPGIPQSPQVWARLCGLYRFTTHRTDPARSMIGAGAQVAVRRGRLVLRFLGPVPALLRGTELRPDDPGDPYVFRIALPWPGSPTVRVVFSGPAGGPAEALHLDLGPLTLTRAWGLRDRVADPPPRVSPPAGDRGAPAGSPARISPRRPAAERSAS